MGYAAAVLPVVHLPMIHLAVVHAGVLGLGVAAGHVEHQARALDVDLRDGLAAVAEPALHGLDLVTLGVVDPRRQPADGRAGPVPLGHLGHDEGLGVVPDHPRHERHVGVGEPLGRGLLALPVERLERLGRRRVGLGEGGGGEGREQGEDEGRAEGVASRHGRRIRARWWGDGKLRGASRKDARARRRPLQRARPARPYAARSARLGAEAGSGPAHVPSRRLKKRTPLRIVQSSPAVWVGADDL